VSGPAPRPALPARALVASRILPPGPEGQHIVLERLLSGFDPDSYCLSSTELPASRTGGRGSCPPLPARYYHLKCGEVDRLPPLDRPLGRSERWRALARLAAVALQVARVARREGSEILVGCTASFYEPAAAALAARGLRRPFVAYLLDEYAGQWLFASWRDWAARLEPWIVRSAARVLVPNETLAEIYRRRYGRGATVVRNPIAPQFTSPAPDPAPAGGTGRRRIVFTGTLYDVHYDGFRRLFAALRRERERRYDVEVHTWQEPETLRRILAAPELVVRPFAPPERIAAAQRAADVLFLPVAFRSGFDFDHLLGAAPTKMGEYLASGRPILAHAPPDSFTSRHLRERDAAWVVDRPEAEALAAALAEIESDPVLGARRAAAALRTAREYELETCRGRFADELRIAAGGGG
jgi:glycosyltransferase involved in cell wall biosynthesis